MPHSTFKSCRNRRYFAYKLHITRTINSFTFNNIIVVHCNMRREDSENLWNNQARKPPTPIAPCTPPLLWRGGAQVERRRACRRASANFRAPCAVAARASEKQLGGGARGSASERESERETRPRGVPQTAIVYESRAPLLGGYYRFTLSSIYLHFVFCLSQ